MRTACLPTVSTLYPMSGGGEYPPGHTHLHSGHTPTWHTHLSKEGTWYQRYPQKGHGTMVPTPVDRQTSNLTLCDVRMWKHYFLAGGKYSTTSATSTPKQQSCRIKAVHPEINPVCNSALSHVIMISLPLYRNCMSIPRAESHATKP